MTDTATTTDIPLIAVTLEQFIHLTQPDSLSEKPGPPLATAFRKWAEAEALLWSEDPDSKLTNIGHLCREALQEFVQALAARVGPPELDSDKAHTVNRLKAVIGFKAPQLGTTLKPFLEAFVEYWEASTELVQRQEHGGQTEGEPLRWEDGRRVVFQTSILMFEVDRAVT